MPTIAKDSKTEVMKYIEALPEWSKKMCSRLRQIILNADSSIEEDWKWGPHYKSNGMVCGFSAFKNHVKITFFNGSAMKDKKGLFNHCVDNEFSRSIKLTEEDEINEKNLTEYVKESVAVNRKGFKREVKTKEVTIPEDLLKALSKNKDANQFFNGLTYGYKKEFVEYITTAKQEATKKARIEKTVALCKEGKRLNDQYRG